MKSTPTKIVNERKTRYMKPSNIETERNEKKNKQRKTGKSNER